MLRSREDGAFLFPSEEMTFVGDAEMTPQMDDGIVAERIDSLLALELDGWTEHFRTLRLLTLEIHQRCIP